MAHFEIQNKMQTSYDCESERDTSETVNQGFFWPSALLPGHVVTKCNRFGFELILPGYSQRSLEVESNPAPVTFSPHLSSVNHHETNENSGLGSKVDFDGIDRLFKKLKGFDGKLTIQKGFGFEEGNLGKRPPNQKGKLKEDSESVETSTVYSSYSRIFEGASASQEKGFNKSQLQTKEKENKLKTRNRNPPTKIVLPMPPPDKAPLSRSDRHLRILERERQNKANQRDEEDKKFLGEQGLIDILKAIVFNDVVNSDSLRKLSDFDRELVLKLIRLRYKGAELMRFPFKSRNFSTYNTRSHFRLVNEKKLLGEMWPSIIDQLKKIKNIWRHNKDDEIIDLFKIYHKQPYQEKIKVRLEPQALKELDENDDTLLVNLFAEFYLGFRP